MMLFTCTDYFSKYLNEFILLLAEKRVRILLWFYSTDLELFQFPLDYLQGDYKDGSKLLEKFAGIEGCHLLAEEVYNLMNCNIRID